MKIVTNRNFGMRECPSCATQVPANNNRCPICGYEFPALAAPRRRLRLAVAVLMILILLLLVLRFW